MNIRQIREIKSVFQSYPSVKLAYFFGSRNENKAAPLSDYDFAIYFDKQNKKRMFDIKLSIIGKLTDILKTDKIDLVIINTTEKPDLKFFIINEGTLLYKKEPYKILVEPQIMNQYFDFNLSLKRNGLTQ
ncbi:MAG: nucleotidyltransferase domain-containing protein [Elusimicrobia bacterium]|nr:nucleotidyltransferase domain-containing protein [Elusimicrobiota bacterium]